MSEPTTPNEREALHNPWRESLENCIEGSNYLRASEYRQLIDELDRLYAIAQRTEPAAPVAQIEHTIGGSIEFAPLTQAAYKLPQGVKFKLYAHPQASTAAVPEGAEPVACTNPDGLRKLKRGFGVIVSPTPEMHPEGETPLFAHPPRESGDAQRYRAFFDSGLPVCFMGQEFRSKEECDKAIDAAIRSAAYQGKEGGGA